MRHARYAEDVVRTLLSQLVITNALAFGATWTEVNTGLGNLDIRSLAVDPANPSTVYAGTGNGVFKSTDGGATWHHSGLTDWATSHLVINFVNPTIVYAATQCTRTVCFCSERVLFKSTDGGATWSDSVSPPGSGMLRYSSAIDGSYECGIS